VGLPFVFFSVFLLALSFVDFLSSFHTLRVTRELTRNYKAYGKAKEVGQGIRASGVPTT
jgi:hypothetical protein